MYSSAPLVASGIAVPPPEGFRRLAKYSLKVAPSLSSYDSTPMCRIEIELGGDTEGERLVVIDEVQKVALDVVDGDGKVSDIEAPAETPPVGAYSEPYAPLPGRNNRSCICAV